jgi:rod shape determining protein RodA
LWTALAIIAIPAVVVLAIPDVGSLLVFGAFFIALYREGLSGWLFGLGFLFAVVFLVSLAINPLYVVLGILIITGLLIFFNYYKIPGILFPLLYCRLSACSERIGYGFSKNP